MGQSLCVVSQPVSAEGVCSVSLENLPSLHPPSSLPFGFTEPRNHDHGNRVSNQRGGEGERAHEYTHQIPVYKADGI